MDLAKELRFSSVIQIRKVVAGTILFCYFSLSSIADGLVVLQGKHAIKHIMSILRLSLVL